MTAGPSHIFFYGSLLTGTGVPAVDRILARRLRFVAPARIRARLYMLDGYPGAVAAAHSGAWVHGKVFRLLGTARMLRVVDAYERYMPDRMRGSEFVRLTTAAHCSGTGTTLPVWVYYYNRPVKLRRRIAGGDYLRHLRPASKTATPSTWAVWGNISTAPARVRR